MVEKIDFTSPSRVGGGVPFLRNGQGTPNAVKFLTGADARGNSWTAQVLGGESRYGGTESIERVYEESGWAHIAIKAIASAVRQCPLVFYEDDPKTNPDAQPIPEDHPLAKLFKDPNRLMDPARFIEAGAIHRKLDGEDFWFLFNDLNHPVEITMEGKKPFFDYPAWIMPVRGRSVKMKADEHGFPAIWKYPIAHSDGIAFHWGAVIQFADYDPDNPLRGLGDTQAILRDLALEFGGQRYLEAMLANSGDPGGVITSEDPMSEEEEARASREVGEKFSLENAFKWHVISGEGVKYTPNKYGPKDMQFQELLKWIRDKTGSVYGVPLPVMGILDDANFANYGEAVRQFWQHGNGVLAYMTTVENVVNHQFLPRLKNAQARTFVCRFDTSHVEALQDDKVAKVELALKLLQAKAGFSWEEAAMIAGLPLTDIVTKYGEHAFMDPNTTTAEMIIKFAEEKAQNDAAATAPPAVDNAGEEDDFPGSDGFDSGSNGPTGSDGKTAPRADQDGGPAATAVHVQREALPTDDAGIARRDYYKGTDESVLRPGEERVRRAAKNFLTKYAAAQFKLIEDFARNGMIGLAKAGNPVSPADIIADEVLMGNLLLAYAEWVKKMAEEMGVPLSEVLEAAADDFAPEIGAAPIPIDDPWASNFLRTNNIRLAEGVNSTLAELVRDALVSAFEKRPFDMATLQEQVRRALPELRDSLKRAFSGRAARASTIARTEVNRAANGTRFEQMRREGIEEHQWVTSGDAHVRSRDPHSHVALDGEIRKVGDSFRESMPLLHPGDPAGDPEDVINCRCVTRPIVKD